MSDFNFIGAESKFDMRHIER